MSATSICHGRRRMDCREILLFWVVWLFFLGVSLASPFEVGMLDPYRLHPYTGLVTYPATSATRENDSKRKPSIIGGAGFHPSNNRRSAGRLYGVVVPFLFRRRLLRQAKDRLVRCELNREVQGTLRLFYAELEEKLGTCVQAKEGTMEALARVARKWVYRFVRGYDERLRFRVLDFYSLYRHTQCLGEVHYRRLWQYIHHHLQREESTRTDDCLAQRAIFRAVLLYEIQFPALQEGSWVWLRENAANQLSYHFFGASYGRLPAGIHEQVDYYMWILERHWCGFVNEARLSRAVP